MLQPRHDRDTGRIGQVAIVVEYMYISVDAPAADSFENAKRLSIKGIGTADDTVEDVGEVGFEIIGPVCSSS